MRKKELLDTSTIGGRIRAVREVRQGPSGRKLVEELGVTESTLYNWQRDQNKPPVEALQKIADLFGVQYEWLSTGRGEMLPVGGSREARQNGGGEAGRAGKVLTEFDVTAGAGSMGGLVVTETPIGEYVIDTVEIESLRDHRPREPFVVRMIGESMEPEFRSGDKLIIEPFEKGSRQIRADAIYLFRLEDDIQVKQLERRPGQRLLIKPLNERYGAYEVGLKDSGVDFEIIGRVFGRFKRY
jgi:phage repressor protein C with HTH and peptisase S24 domain